jgi:mRNA interferase MazF
VIRGAVYRVDLGPARGQEQRGKCLGLVVSPSQSPLSVATVVPSSTSAGPAIHRPELEIAGRTTRLLVDQIRSIDIDYIHGDPVDCLTRDQLAQVDFAIAPTSAYRTPLRRASPPAPIEDRTCETSLWMSTLHWLRRPQRIPRVLSARCRHRGDPRGCGGGGGAGGSRRVASGVVIDASTLVAFDASDDPRRDGVAARQRRPRAGRPGTPGCGGPFRTSPAESFERRPGADRAGRGADTASRM